MKCRFQVMYYWAENLPLSFIRSQAHISKEISVDWAMYMREITRVFVEAHQQPIGGPNTVVEIDESVFFRRKYHRGFVREHIWVFGAVERGTRNMVTFVVEDRTRQTLEALILQWILPGTVIVSDMWGAYVNLRNLGYLNAVVQWQRLDGVEVRRDTFLEASSKP